MCAGGRYDGLVEQLGGKATPALGFALGMERTILLVQKTFQESAENRLHIYFVSDTEQTFKSALKLSDQLRDALPHLRIMIHCGGGSFKNQLKKADKSGALYALILGEQEQLTNSITLKALREAIPQQTFLQSELILRLSESLAI